MWAKIVFSWVRQLFFIVNNNAFLDEQIFLNKMLGYCPISFIE